MKGFLSASMAIMSVMATVMGALGAAPETSIPDAPPAPARAAKVVVIPIRAAIASPELYILRRGLKQAIEDHVDTIVLDMETPGGALDVTFEMIKALEKFPGRTITYVNREAMSAGALIAAGTSEIYFEPGAVMGAAAPVDASGRDIDATMRSKIVSYLKARIRAMSEGKGYRGQVISAMVDADAEFKIGDEVIKPKGELLSLTASEAVKLYGNPPQPLLAAGIAPDIESLLDKIHGRGNYQSTRLSITWSEQLAQYLTRLTPLLLACGMLCLFIEFKTPGFGIFGISGIILMVVVFFGHQVAGLSGEEPLLVFLLGLSLIVIELFFFPGTMLLALIGGTMIFGSLVWAMLDLWPNEPLSLSGDLLLMPLVNVLGGVLLAIALFLALLRFLPRGGLWGNMVLEASVGGAPTGVRPIHPAMADFTQPAPAPGQTGHAVTPLFPSGQIEIDGRRYEARLAVGHADVGTPLRVTDIGEFGLMVEVIS